MNWNEIKPYGNSDPWTYWVSGIYKIVTYDDTFFQAYYIREGEKNWGWYVCEPPYLNDKGYKCWSSLGSAKSSCEIHSLTHKPKPATIRRASEVEAALVADSMAA